MIYVDEFTKMADEESQGIHIVVPNCSKEWRVKTFLFGEESIRANVTVLP